MAVPDFPHIFAAYFYHGEFAELLFCHIVNVVDKGLRVVPASKSKPGKKPKAENPTQKQEPTKKERGFSL